jgi:hypothetical protein
MPTLIITREVALAIRHLKDGRALCRSWNCEYVLCQRARTDDQIVIADRVFEALRKARLIRRCGRGDPYSWWSNWYGRRHTWLLSDAGKEFRLPPEELWIPDEPPS